MKRNINRIIAAFLICLIFLSGCSFYDGENTLESVSLENIPEYSGKPYVAVNDNIPYFSQDELTDISFEEYSELDSLKRCGAAVASISVDIMPTEDRGEIGQVKPSGWKTLKFDIVDGKYLYNRCHLIGFQLTGENANEKNLITGTRYMNVDGMLPFENMVADYVKETENHVMYRVTPVFYEQELVARGVLIEAFSVEDNGDGILFNVFCYNVQPGITIDYATGSADLADCETENSNSGRQTYILNTNTKKFHLTSCKNASDIKEENREEYNGFRANVIDRGYKPCSICKP